MTSTATATANGSTHRIPATALRTIRRLMRDAQRALDAWMDEAGTYAAYYAIIETVTAIAAEHGYRWGQLVHVLRSMDR